MLTGMKKRIRRIFIAGILVILPVSITFILLSLIFKYLDSWIAPFLTRVLIFAGLDISPDYRIPGLGFVATLILIFFVGLFTTNIVGRKLIQAGENIVGRIPVARNIYIAAKQFLESITITDSSSFRQVVMIQYPRKGIYSVGFITNDSVGEIQSLTRQDMVNVFIPTSPNPTSGMLIVVPKKEVIPLSMNVEDGLKFIISGGILYPNHSRHEPQRIEG